VSWQDELRQLDEELAAGRISAEQYRARRDQVITAAANPTGPQAPSPAEATTTLPPVSGPQPSAEATQVVPNLQQGQPADRTQAVSPNWQSGPRPDAERTQIVPNVPGMGGGYPPGPQSPAQGFPQQPVQPGWGDQADSAPPWAGQDFPPLAANNEAWVKQGPEVFRDGKSHTGRIIAIVIAVVVLAGLGIGAVLLFGKGSGHGSQQAGGPTASTTTAPPTTTTPPSPVRIGSIPGTDTGKKIAGVSDLAQLNYLNPAELQAYQTATNGTGLADVAVHQLDDSDMVVVLTVQAQSGSAANTAMNQLTQIQLGNKANQAESPAPGVQMTELTANGTTTIRAHYVHNNVIVRVEVSGPNPTTALQDFTTVLNAQLAALSANG
jgi:hypothetical protein